MKDHGGGTEKERRESSGTGGEERNSDSESEPEESLQEGTYDTRESETGESESERMPQDQSAARPSACREVLRKWFGAVRKTYNNALESIRDKKIDTFSEIWLKGS